MAKRITNHGGLSLSMAVWLASNPYNNRSEMPDWIDPDDDIISVTTLMQPTRKFILSQKITPQPMVPDVQDRIASAFGTAVHDAMERSWKENHRQSLRDLGYPDHVISRIRINPDEGHLAQGDIPVYLENRYFRKIDGVVISGKYDQIINGEINDTKTTSVYTYINRSKEEDYIIQLSIYRWLNPDKVTSDIGYIQHIFTDWNSAAAQNVPGYPAHRIQQFKIQLMSIPDTERWIRDKLREIRANGDLKQKDMIRCSEKDLWRQPETYRYCLDPAKAKLQNKSTRNFTSKQDAIHYQAIEKGGKGVILPVPGKVKACSYCPAFTICTQKDEYNHD